MNFKLACVCALSTFSTFVFPGKAHAQAPAAQAPAAQAPAAQAPAAQAPAAQAAAVQAPAYAYLQQYLAHVSVQAPPGTELEVVPTGDREASPVIARCKEYCDFWALPGKYTLYAHVHGEDEPKRMSLRIKQSSRFTFDPGDEEGRTTGLAVASVGTVAALAGMGMMFAAFTTDSSEDPHGNGDLAIAGLVTLCAGAVLTPVGWGMYAHNRPHLRLIDNGGYGTLESQRQVRLGVVGMGLGGFGLGGVATF
ncbi:MAG TPA: hypothetical protein VFK05_36920 [Polyangiaceae bacterium]|nr:hypothetical protein [Polyangiaceae bacterium]